MAKRGRPLGSKSTYTSKYNEDFINDLALKLIEWIKLPSNWYLTDFAIENDIWEQRFSEFAGRNEFFADTLKKAKQIQVSRLVKLGLAKKVDTGMAIFTLKNIAGWRDKQEHEYFGEMSEPHLHFTSIQLSRKTEDDLIASLLGRKNLERKSNPTNVN